MKHWTRWAYGLAAATNLFGKWELNPFVIAALFVALIFNDVAFTGYKTTIALQRDTIELLTRTGEMLRARLARRPGS